MMLAFLVDQIQQLCCPLFRAAWAKWGSKRLPWEKMRACFYIYPPEPMRHLFEALSAMTCSNGGPPWRAIRVHEPLPCRLFAI